jgi:hypothetical protein
MKKIFVVILFFFAIFTVKAQVNWNVSTKSINSETYDLILRAKINSPWHLYSQLTPAGGPLPSVITFNVNPIIQLEGKIEEKGKIVIMREAAFGIDVKYYEDSVSFVQRIHIKADVKTKISGNIRYMICNDRECLPPKNYSFQTPIP